MTGRSLAPAGVTASQTLPSLEVPVAAPPAPSRGATAPAPVLPGSGRSSAPAAAAPLPTLPSPGLSPAAQPVSDEGASAPAGAPLARLCPAVTSAACPTTSRTGLAPMSWQSPPPLLAPAPEMASDVVGPTAAEPENVPPRRGHAPAAPPATPESGAGVVVDGVPVAPAGASDSAPRVATSGAPLAGDPPRAVPGRDAPGHNPPPAETTPGPDGGSGNAAVDGGAAAAVGTRRRGDDDPAGRRVAARTIGRDVAARRQSRGSGGQDATVSAFYLKGTAHTAQAGPPRPNDLREVVWAEWGDDPVVNWGQVTYTIPGLALLEYGRAARQVGGPLAGSPT